MAEKPENQNFNKDIIAEFLAMFQILTSYKSICRFFSFREKYFIKKFNAKLYLYQKCDNERDKSEKKIEITNNSNGKSTENPDGSLEFQN